jgi:hypothetical protein
MPPRLPIGRSTKPGKPGKPAKPGRAPTKGRPGSAPHKQGVLPKTQEEAQEAGAQGAPRLKMPELLAELEDAAKQLGIRVSYENLAGELGSGGLCKVRGEWRAIVDKRCTPGERVSILAMALTRFPLEGLSISAQLRELVEQARRQAELLAAQGQEPGAEAPSEPREAPSEVPPEEGQGVQATADKHDGLAQSGAAVVS